MAGWATLADLTAATMLTSAWGFLGSGNGETTDSYVKLWSMADPAGTPGAAYSNTSGALASFHDLDPIRKFIVQFTCGMNTNTSPGTLVLADALVGVGGIVLTSTGNKTVNSASLTRYTDGEGVQAFLEVVGATSTSAVVCSMASYTDQDGNTGQVGGTITFPTTAVNAGTVIGPLPLASGDTGIRSVETINIATASGGATSTANLILVKPLTMIGFTENMSAERDSPLPFAIMPRVFDGATLVGLLKGYTGVENVRGYVTVAVG